MSADPKVEAAEAAEREELVMGLVNYPSLISRELKRLDDKITKLEQTLATAREVNKNLEFNRQRCKCGAQ